MAPKPGLKKKGSSKTKKRMGTPSADPVEVWARRRLSRLDAEARREVVVGLRLSQKMYRHGEARLALHDKIHRFLKKTLKEAQSLANAYDRAASGPINPLRHLAIPWTAEQEAVEGRVYRLRGNRDRGLLALLQALANMFGATLHSRDSIREELKARGVSSRSFSLSEKKSPEAAQLFLDDGAWYLRLERYVDSWGAHGRLKQALVNGDFSEEEADQLAREGLRSAGFPFWNHPNLADLDRLTGKVFWPGGRPPASPENLKAGVDRWEAAIKTLLPETVDVTLVSADSLAHQLGPQVGRARGRPLSRQETDQLLRSTKFGRGNLRSIARLLYSLETGQPLRKVRDKDRPAD